MEPLTTVDDLAKRLGAPDLLVLDIRSAVDGGGRTAFEAGHVPGAVHTDYVADGWRAAKDGAPGLLPEPEALAALFGRLGIRPASQVVIAPAGVSAGDFSAAARVYWTLKAAGHPARSILEGGFKAWAAAGQPIEAGPGRLMAAGPYPVKPDPSVRATLAEVESLVRDGGAALVDSRGSDFFAGEAMSPQARRPGRLPGAIHVDNASAYDSAANRLRPRVELERLFAPVPAGPAVSYCNTGQVAATDWFVLSEILGRPEASLYDGSMSQGTQDATRPVEAG